MASPYRAVNVPSECQVIVTNSSLGPSKFWIRLINWEAGYQKLQNLLDQTKIDDRKLLSSTPKSGTACIAKISDKFHRGLVLSSNCDLETSIVRLVDTGCEETLPNSSLFETSHKFLYYAQCSTCVSLVDGQALSSKHGINWMFAKLVSNMDISLNCKVVAKEPARHTVLLSDENQDIGEYLLELYNNGTISYLLTPSPTPSPGIEIQTEPDAASRTESTPSLKEAVIVHPSMVSTHGKPSCPRPKGEELTRFTVQIDKIKKEQEALIRQKEQLEREEAQKKAENEIHIKDVLKLRTKLDSVTIILKQLKVEKKEEQNRLDNLASEKEAIEDEKESMIQQKNQLGMDLAQRKSDVEKCSEGVRNLRAECDSSTGILMKLQVQMKEEQSRREDLDSQKETLEKEKESLRRKNQQMQSDLDQQKAAFEECSDMHRKLRSRFDSLSVTLMQSLFEKTEEEIRLNDLVSQIKTIGREKEYLVHQKNQIESDLALMKENVAEQQAGLEIRREEHRKLRAEVDLITAARTQLEIQVKESQETLNDLASRHQDQNMYFPLDRKEEVTDLGAEPLVQEVGTVSNGHLNNPAETLILPHTDKTHSPDSEEEEGKDDDEEEEQALSVESIDNLKPQPAEGEFTSDITEPVNVDVLDEETLSGLEVQAAELVDDHPTPFQSVEKSKDSILIGDLTALNKTCQLFHDVKVAPEIDLITTSLEEQQDHKLVPVDQVLAEGSSNTGAIGQKSTDEEDIDTSIFVEEELSESDACINHSILTAETAPIGSTFEEQKAASITISDEPSIPFDLKPATPLEEEPKTASILTDGEEEDSSDPSESIADEDAETFDPVEGKPVAPVLIESEMPTDPLTTSDPTVYGEEETALIPKEETASDPAVADLIPFDGKVCNKIATLSQLVLEVGTSADGDQIVTHTESTNLRDTEEKEQAGCFESLIEMNVASDPFATSEPFVNDEEEIAPILKEETVSDPAVSDLILLETGDGRKLSIPAQLVQEVATDADGDLVVTLAESTNAPDIEVERPTVCFEPFENSKQEIVKDDTTSDIIEPANLDGVEEESPSGREEELSVEAGTSEVNEEEVSDPEDASSELLTPLHPDALASKVEHPESASSDIEKEDGKEPLAQEEQTTGSEFDIHKKIMEQPFSSSLPTPDGSVLDESSNLDLLNLSMVCNSGEETEDIDDQLASPPGLLDDLLINGLLNRPVVSQSDWKTVVGTRLDVIADDSLIVNCGEVDEEPDFIPEGSGITVEAEVEGDSLEEPSSLFTPVGLEVSHQKQDYEQRSDVEDVKPKVTRSVQADLESRAGHNEPKDDATGSLQGKAINGECTNRDYEPPMVTVSIVKLADVATDVEEERNELDWALAFVKLFSDEHVDSEEEGENQPEQTAQEDEEVEFDPDLTDQSLGFSG